MKLGMHLHTVKWNIEKYWEYGWFINTSDLSIGTVSVEQSKDCEIARTWEMIRHETWMQLWKKRRGEHAEIHRDYRFDRNMYRNELDRWISTENREYEDESEQSVCRTGS